MRPLPQAAAGRRLKLSHLSLSLLKIQSRSVPPLAQELPPQRLQTSQEQLVQDTTLPFLLSRARDPHLSTWIRLMVRVGGQLTEKPTQAEVLGLTSWQPEDLPTFNPQLHEPRVKHGLSKDAMSGRRSLSGSWSTSSRGSREPTSPLTPPLESSAWEGS